MQKNIGEKDRIVRFIIAFLLFVYAIWSDSLIATALGFFVLFEAYMSWCIFYQLIGKNTCPIKKNEKK